MDPTGKWIQIDIRPDFPGQPYSIIKAKCIGVCNDEIVVEGANGVLSTAHFQKKDVKCWGILIDQSEPQVQPPHPNHPSAA